MRLLGGRPNFGRWSGYTPYNIHRISLPLDFRCVAADAALMRAAVSSNVWIPFIVAAIKPGQFFRHFVRSVAPVAGSGCHFSLVVCLLMTQSHVLMAEVRILVHSGGRDRMHRMDYSRPATLCQHLFRKNDDRSAALSATSRRSCKPFLAKIYFITFMSLQLHLNVFISLALSLSLQFIRP